MKSETKKKDVGQNFFFQSQNVIPKEVFEQDQFECFECRKVEDLFGYFVKTKKNHRISYIKDQFNLLDINDIQIGYDSQYYTFKNKGLLEYTSEAQQKDRKIKIPSSIYFQEKQQQEQEKQKQQQSQQQLQDEVLFMKQQLQTVTENQIQIIKELNIMEMQNNMLNQFFYNINISASIKFEGFQTSQPLSLQNRENFQKTYQLIDQSFTDMKQILNKLFSEKLDDGYKERFFHYYHLDKQKSLIKIEIGTQNSQRNIENESKIKEMSEVSIVAFLCYTQYKYQDRKNIFKLDLVAVDTNYQKMGIGSTIIKNMQKIINQKFQHFFVILESGFDTLDYYIKKQNFRILPVVKEEGEIYSLSKQRKQQNFQILPVVKKERQINPLSRQKMLINLKQPTIETIKNHYKMTCKLTFELSQENAVSQFLSEYLEYHYVEGIQTYFYQNQGDEQEYQQILKIIIENRMSSQAIWMIKQFQFDNFESQQIETDFKIDKNISSSHPKKINKEVKCIIFDEFSKVQSDNIKNCLLLAKNLI